MSTMIEAPAENFTRGLKGIEIPELGPKEEGKVRDSWVVDTPKGKLRVMVTTDRTSAYDHQICTVPGKGQVLNELSSFWFSNTEDIVGNHKVLVPHPNVLIAKQAEQTLPVEIVLRRYMARSNTPTSISRNYREGRRNIYGIDFPEGLQENQLFPTTLGYYGIVVTPTTKAEKGMHDHQLTELQVRESVDYKFGYGTWNNVLQDSLCLFVEGSAYAKKKGLLLVDTKYEFGVNEKGWTMVIDEMHTPDSSRYWLEESYQERFDQGQDPETFDKEILRKWLAEQGFTGQEGQIIPSVDPRIIDKMSEAYKTTFEMLTGQKLTKVPQDPDELVHQIRDSVLNYLNSLTP